MLDDGRLVRETRARVVTAARRLFKARGHATTTIHAIAEEAGVAVPRVYDASGSKREILEAARLEMLAESEIPALLADRGARCLAQAGSSDGRRRQPAGAGEHAQPGNIRATRL